MEGYLTDSDNRALPDGMPSAPVHVTCEGHEVVELRDRTSEPGRRVIQSHAAQTGVSRSTGWTWAGKSRTSIIQTRQDHGNDER